MASTVLSFDPGAKRCGWACLELGPTYIASGILGLSRTRNEKKAEYQEYRLSLIDYWLEEASRLILEYQPSLIVNEIVPVVGGGNFVVATQSQLAATAITTIQAVAMEMGISVRQIGAGHIQRRIGGVKDASKVRVRNGVLALLPELEPRKRELTKPSDESDAIAVGLCALGYEYE